MKLAAKRTLVVASVAVMSATVVFVPTAHAKEDYTTEVEASFTDDGVRYSIDAEGDDDSGARGTWTMRDDGDQARGRVVCVAGSEVDGTAAAIVVDITSSNIRGLSTRDYVLHYLWDREEGRDKHRWREIDGPGRHNHRSCPEDGFEPRNLDKVRGDIDIDIEDAD